jgi:hypothetical protein
MHQEISWTYKFHPNDRDPDFSIELAIIVTLGMAELALISPLISLTVFLSQYLYKKWHDVRENAVHDSEATELCEAIHILKSFADVKVHEFSEAFEALQLNQDTWGNKIRYRTDYRSYAL